MPENVVIGWLLLSKALMLSSEALRSKFVFCVKWPNSSPYGSLRCVCLHRDREITGSAKHHGVKGVKDSYNVVNV
ncbi:hypothetical protein F5Y06DRAFT_55394 [Hypoxylon sp. FL0890]|nr:hypothetical protein F5Y06DRAFT_55394 [Hypoxylon sp. FL0890]